MTVIPSNETFISWTLISFEQLLWYTLIWNWYWSCNSLICSKKSISRKKRKLSCRYILLFWLFVSSMRPFWKYYWPWKVGSRSWMYVYLLKTLFCKRVLVKSYLHFLKGGHKCILRHMVVIVSVFCNILILEIFSNHGTVATFLSVPKHNYR